MPTQRKRRPMLSYARGRRVNANAMADRLRLIFSPVGSGRWPLAWPWNEKAKAGGGARTRDQLPLPTNYKTEDRTGIQPLNKFTKNERPSNCPTSQLAWRLSQLRTSGGAKRTQELFETAKKQFGGVVRAKVFLREGCCVGGKTNHCATPSLNTWNPPVRVKSCIRNMVPSIVIGWTARGRTLIALKREMRILSSRSAEFHRLTTEIENTYFYK